MLLFREITLSGFARDISLIKFVYFCLPSVNTTEVIIKHNQSEVEKETNNYK